MPSLTGQLPAELRSHGLRWLGLLASYAHVIQNLLTTYGSGETQSLRRPPGGPEATVRELGGINSQRHLGLSCGAGYSSHKATTVSRKENLLRNCTHCFLTGSGTDRLCCWVKTFPQLGNKRRLGSSLTGTSRDRDTRGGTEHSRLFRVAITVCGCHSTQSASPVPRHDIRSVLKWSQPKTSMPSLRSHTLTGFWCLLSFAIQCKINKS